ncbi:hypothetical protein A4H97_09715 [Niastella yeongjuensis]|uniref:DUF7691 domain-containing protein n=1 Tax=Niastella yeongjuensis TaxID=354355 RepID=A0A1V9EFA5_9BACT|nr:hypothetical protein [Niastella yeongjuensis]OQP44634.1 hypothetical protein A4H97_09715 [Niastella yeongjuensis]SEO80576.1 hypothetical protein SAMN05660816_03599 [Niastella yeongjuensis]
MGYYIFSYGINTVEIQKVFGSKDQAILNQVQSDKTFKHYESEINGSSISLSSALVEIIEGRPVSIKNDDVFGYAFLCICASLGKELPFHQDIKLGNDTNLINKILSDDFGIKDFDTERTLFRNSHTFPISKTLDPGTGVIKQEELTAIKDKLSSVQISDEKIQELARIPDDREFGYENLQGLILNINYCVAHNLDLISFCH